MRARSLPILAFAWCQIHMLRQLVAGWTLAEAAPHELALMRCMAPRVGLHVLPGARMTRVPTRCVGFWAAAQHEALITGVPHVLPELPVDEETLTAAIWCLDAVRRHAQGVPVLEAVTQARAAVAGKPRKKRKGAGAGKVLGEIDALLASLAVLLDPYVAEEVSHARRLVTQPG